MVHDWISTFRRSCFIGGWLAGCGSLLIAGDWTKFQCAVGTDVQVDSIPLHWSPDKNMAWKVELTGYGQSSPVTWNSRIYVTSISGPKKEHCHVTAFDLQTSQQLWQHSFDAASGAENNNYVSKAAPSPAVDQEGVYCFFEGGNLLSLTHEGKVRWSRNLVQEFGDLESRHGLSASLEQMNDRLFVWVERTKEPYVLAIDTSNGKDVWKVAGVGATSWASPRLIPMPGGPHLVLSAIGSVTGLDPQTGKELWKLSGIVGNSTPTPVPAGEGRFLIGATQGRGEAESGKASGSNGLVAVQKADDGTFQAEYVWRCKRATSSFGSPAACNGFAYFVNALGVLFCHDLETGEERYAERISDSIWATPVVVRDRLYFFGKGGTASVISAGPTFEKLAENPAWQTTPAAEGGERPRFGGPVLYAAVLAGDRWLLRRGDVLYCVAGTDE